MEANSVQCTEAPGLGEESQAEKQSPLIESIVNHALNPHAQISHPKAVLNLPRGLDSVDQQSSTVCSPVADKGEIVGSGQDAASSDYLQPCSSSDTLERQDASAQSVQPKWSSYIDKSSRLLDDSLGQIEYVKGIGAMVVTDYREQHTGECFTRKQDLGDHVFIIMSFSTTSRFALTSTISWKSKIDSFEIIIREKDIVFIPACDIVQVYYSIEQRKCAFESRPLTDGAHKDVVTTILQIGGDEAEPFRLRSLLEKRFGAVKVNKAESEWFAEQEHLFEQTRHCVQPKSPTEVMSIDASNLRDEPNRDDSDVELSNHREQDVNESFEEFEALVFDWATSPLTQSSKATESQGVIHRSQDFISSDIIDSTISQQVYDHEPMLPCALGTQTSFDINLENHLSKTIAPFDMICASTEALKELDQFESSSIPSDDIARYRPLEDADYHQQLRYQSGEIVRRCDLVVRMRDPSDHYNGKNKFNHLDVYDGPFRVAALPSSTKAVIDLFSSDSEIDDSTPRHYARKKLIQDEKLIKLDFPESSKAEPWTKIRRLRPVYEINPNITPKPGARLCYYYVRKLDGVKTVINTQNFSDRDDDDGNEIEGVVKLGRGAYTKVKYVAAEGPEDDDRYEVEKLRGKHVYRFDRSVYPDERMDDERIRRYFEEEGGMMASNEVLVAMYFVHWAGWPSEDDSWERGQGNVPQEFIDAWDVATTARMDSDNDEHNTPFRERSLGVKKRQPRSAKTRC